MFHPEINVDFVMNGSGTGSTSRTFEGVQFQPSLLRPYWNHQGVACVSLPGKPYWNVKTKQMDRNYHEVPIKKLQERGIHSPVFNATSLRKEDWIQIDRRVKMVARERLTAWMDLVERGLTFGGFNAMARTTLEYEAMSDPGEAVIDMDARGVGRNDSPLFSLRSLPLPITHSDYQISQRSLMVSRNSGTPLDSTLAEACSRRVAESIEKTLIGTVTGSSFGYVSSGPTAHEATSGSTVYGYTNFPYRNTKTDLTSPTSGSWSPSDTVNDVLEMRQLMFDDNHYGPFMLYHSDDWDVYLDDDYAYTDGSNWGVAADQTLRQRLGQIEGILGVKRLDYLNSSSNPFTLLLVQMTSDNVEAVNGMEITTVQWEGRGGLELNFKVMAIQVPRLKFDYAGNSGFVHATTS